MQEHTDAVIRTTNVDGPDNGQQIVVIGGPDTTFVTLEVRGEDGTTVEVHLTRHQAADLVLEVGAVAVHL